MLVWKGFLTEIFHRNIHVLLTIVSQKGTNYINLASKQMILVISGEIQGHSLKRDTILRVCLEPG